MFKLQKFTIATAVVATAASLGFSQTVFADPTATVGKSGASTVQPVPKDIQKLFDKSRHWENEAARARKQMDRIDLQIAVLDAKIQGLEAELRDPAKAGLTRALTIAINGARADREMLEKVWWSHFNSKKAAQRYMKEADTILKRAGYKKLDRDWWRRPTINLDPNRDVLQRPNRDVRPKPKTRTATGKKRPTVNLDPKRDGLQRPNRNVHTKPKPQPKPQTVAEKRAAFFAGTWELHTNGHIKVAKWLSHKGMILSIQNTGTTLVGTLTQTNASSRDRGWETGMVMFRIPVAELAHLRRYGAGFKYGGTVRTREGSWKSTDAAIVYYKGGMLEIDQFWTYRFRQTN